MVFFLKSFVLYFGSELVRFKACACLFLIYRSFGLQEVFKLHSTYVLLKNINNQHCSKNTVFVKTVSIKIDVLCDNFC